MKRTICWIFAAVGGITVALLTGAYVMYLLSGVTEYPESHEFNARKELPSSDGEYKATLYLGMGGAAAGWCNEAITIKPRLAEPETFPLQYKVFSVSCGSNTEIRWLSSTLLHIKFSIKGRSGGASVYLRGTDSTGKVKVEYEVEA